MSDDTTRESLPGPTDPVMGETVGSAQERARGMAVLTSSEFSLEQSIGGARGVIEALAPGIVFVVVFVATRELTPTLIASLAIAFIAVGARLIQRTPITQALSGTFGVAIGVFWAWRTGDAKDFFAAGLWTNGAYLALCLVSILVRWPVVGLIVEMMRGAAGSANPAASDVVDADAAGSTVAPSQGSRAAHDTRTRNAQTPLLEQPAGEPLAVEPLEAEPQAAEPLTPSQGPSIGAILSGWRADRALVRRYAIATWLWVGLFGVRLLVQLPLYLEDGGDVGWLGTARLTMGVPLWALTLWGTWVVVRPTAPVPSSKDGSDQPRPRLDR